MDYTFASAKRLRNKGIPLFCLIRLIDATIRLKNDIVGGGQQYGAKYG